MPDIQFPTASSAAGGYLAVPAGERGPATIVLHEQWGLDRHIRSVCDRLAGEGIFALAPDLHLSDTTTQPSDAARQTHAVSLQTAERHMRGAVEHLLSTPGVHGPGVGALGFGLGGGLAVWAAASCPQVAATVTYYCILPHPKPDFTQITGPVLGHFGTADIFISLKDAKALEMDIRTAGVNVEFDKYTAAGHAFFNHTSRLATYDPAASERSWQRSVNFLHATLAPPEMDRAA